MRDVFDGDFSALRIFFESGGASSAWSESTIFTTVYDADQSALRVTISGDNSALFHAHLPSDTSVADDWTSIVWNSDTKSNFTHSDGSEEITVDNAGNYMVMVSLVADYDADDEIHYVRLSREPA